MRLPKHNLQTGSVLIIVLWIVFGLVAITLYSANSMNSELRASDNRVSMMAADQTIEAITKTEQVGANEHPIAKSKVEELPEVTKPAKKAAK